MQAFRKIVVATDFDDASERALELAIDLATRYAAELIVVHGVDLRVPPYPIALMPDPEKIAAAAQLGLLSVVERVKETVPAARGVLLRGKPAEEIIAFVEDNAADLVVVGTHGRKGPSRWLMGSVAERIVRGCRVSVLTAHAAPPASP